MQFPIMFKPPLADKNPSTNSQRNIPVRGFRPVWYLLGMSVIMTYGWYRAGQGIRERKYDISTLPLHAPLSYITASAVSMLLHSPLAIPFNTKTRCW